MYAFDYHARQTLADALADLAQRGRQGAGRRHDPDPDAEAAARHPGLVVDLAAIAGLTGITRDGDDLVIGAMTRHADVADSRGREGGDPGAGRARRHDRRPGGAQPRHDRRLDRQQRSGRRLSRRGAGARRDDRDQQAPRSPPTISSQGMFETALEPGEIITAVRFPIPEKAAYVKFRNPASRYAIVGVFVAKTGRAACASR